MVKANESWTTWIGSQRYDDIPMMAMALLVEYLESNVQNPYIYDTLRKNSSKPSNTLW